MKVYYLSFTCFASQAINTVRIEAQMQLNRAIIEERTLKDIAIQEALAQARAELHDKLGSVVVTWGTDHDGQAMDDMIDDDTDRDRSDDDDDQDKWTILKIMLLKCESIIGRTLAASGSRVVIEYSFNVSVLSVFVL